MGFFDWFAGENRRRPSARRVAARAMVLSTVVCRAYLEREHRAGIHENAEGRSALLDWLEESNLDSELEPDELRFLQLPVGQANDQIAIDSLWRREGLGLLAWSLGRFELPPYDQITDPDAAQQAVGFLEPVQEQDLRKGGVLRPVSEIQRLASHVTIVSWRLRQFRIDPERAAASMDFQVDGEHPVPVAGSIAMRKPSGQGIGERMDFAAYLRAHPRFQEYWLDGLRLIDGDLAIGNKSLANADADDVQTCMSIAVERQIAAYWLQGDERTYSKVEASTLLSGC